MIQSVREATLDDVLYLSQHLREADSLECLTIHATEEEALRQAFSESSLSYVLCVDDVPFCIYGISLVADLWGGAVWMMGTDVLPKQKMFFLRHIREVITNWVQEYQRLFNVVWTKNVLHMNWLSYMGFSFGDEVEYMGHTFRSFELCVQ